LIHRHVGRFVSYKAFWARLEQPPSALFFQVGDDDVREAVPGVVLQDQRQVLEGQGLIFLIGGDAGARAAELGDLAELEQRRAEPTLQDGRDRRLAGTGSPRDKDERPHDPAAPTARRAIRL
jgi:hypothetical protein